MSLNRHLVDSGTIPSEVVDPIFLPHLKVVARHEGIEYVSLDSIVKLFDNVDKMYQLKEEKFRRFQERQHRERMMEDNANEYDPTKG